MILRSNISKSFKETNDMLAHRENSLRSDSWKRVMKSNAPGGDMKRISLIMMQDSLSTYLPSYQVIKQKNHEWLLTFEMVTKLGLLGKYIRSLNFLLKRKTVGGVLRFAEILPRPLSKLVYLCSQLHYASLPHEWRGPKSSTPFTIQSKRKLNLAS